MGEQPPVEAGDQRHRVGTAEQWLNAFAGWSWPPEWTLGGSARSAMSDTLAWHQAVGRPVVMSPGAMAQLVARLHGMEEVWGSNPHSSTRCGVGTPEPIDLRLSRRPFPPGLAVSPTRDARALKTYTRALNIRRASRSPVDAGPSSVERFSCF
jgi:hypothetical protein